MLLNPVHKPDVVVKKVGNETLVYNAGAQMIHVLNPTAQFVWELCDGDHSVAQIEQALRLNFSIPPNHDVTKDVRQILALFKRKGLLKQPAQSTPAQSTDEASIF